MRITHLRIGILTLLLVLLGTANAETPVNKDEDNIAISGYDTVAYFTEERAVKGRLDHQFVWNDVRWLFASGDHRDLFAASPESYAPQFGGFCAGAMTRGIEVKADPEAWTIVDGKLYMKVNQEARDRWRENSAENIEKANKAWAEKTEKNR